jgi:hypothetical protein
MMMKSTTTCCTGSFHILLVILLISDTIVRAGAFSTSAPSSISTNNNNIVAKANNNNIFEFLKWGGSTPDFDVIEKTKEYLSYIESNTTPDPSVYHKDYVLRGPVIGPINLKDVYEVQAGLDLITAFPDLRIESFGHTIDPENPYRCLYFQRWSATHTGILKAGDQILPPTYNKIELPVSVFSVVWTPEQKIIYELVGAVVDRYDITFCVDQYYSTICTHSNKTTFALPSLFFCSVLKGTRKGKEVSTDSCMGRVWIYQVHRVVSI